MEYIDVYNTEYIDSIESSTIRPLFKVEIVDWTERNVISDISDDIIQDSGSIMNNYQQGVRRSISFQLINIEGKYTPSSDTGTLYFGTKFKIYMGIRSLNKEDIYWFTGGVFIITNATNLVKGSNKIVTVSAVDKFGIFGSELGNSQLSSEYQILSGTNIYDAIRDILQIDMQNGNIVDYIDPILDPNYKDEVMPYTLIKNKGTFLSDLLISLANILGCDIFYDSDGHLTIESGTEDITYSQKGVIYNFLVDTNEILEYSLDYDYSKVVNSITVVGTNVNDKIYTYTAQNNNLLSPTRIGYIGMREAETVESAMVSSSQRAEEYAKYLLNKESIMQTLLKFPTTFIPHLDVNRVITISNEDYEFFEERFIIQEITTPIGNGSQLKISCSNISELPYYELEG